MKILSIILVLGLFSCKNSTNSNLDCFNEESVAYVLVDSLVNEKNINSSKISKVSNCKFEFTFDLNPHDEVEKCSFGFLVLDDMKFDSLYFTKNDKTIKIIGSFAIHKNWIDEELPILWIQKKISGQESFQGVNNLYVQFENFYPKEDIKLKIKEMCEIEDSLTAKISLNQSIACFSNIPEHFPAWRLHINVLNIPEKPNS